MSTVTKLSSDQFPKVTRAAILVEQRQPLVVDEIALPDYLDVGQVLVELAYSGICGSQLGEIDGTRLSDVIRRNTALTNLQSNVFVSRG